MYFISTHEVTSVFKTVTDGVTRVLGYEKSDLIGTFSYDKIHIDDMRRVSKSHVNSLNGDTNKLYYRMRAKNGKYILMFAASTTVDINGEKVIIVYNEKCNLIRTFLFKLGFTDA
jgi:hypothetical protein